MKIKLFNGDYSSNSNCPIAKGLKRKLIISMVRGEDWCGLFLGFIPVWGNIPNKTSDEAIRVGHGGTATDKYFEIGLFK